MKRSKKRNYAIIVLLILLIAIAVGYAAFQTVLNINGTVSTTANWKVEFTEAKLLDKDGHDADSAHYGTAVVTDAKTVTATVKLAYPGDAVKLQTVISNLGNLDAKLKSINVDTSGLTDTDIIVTPTAAGQDGLPAAGEKLAVGASCTSEFVVQWNPESKKDSTTGTFKVTFTYDQDAQAITITPAHGHNPANP